MTFDQNIILEIAFKFYLPNFTSLLVLWRFNLFGIRAVVVDTVSINNRVMHCPLMAGCNIVEKINPLLQ